MRGLLSFLLSDLFLFSNEKGRFPPVGAFFPFPQFLSLRTSIFDHFLSSLRYVTPLFCVCLSARDRLTKPSVFLVLFSSLAGGSWFTVFSDFFFSPFFYFILKNSNSESSSPFCLHRAFAIRLVSVGSFLFALSTTLIWTRSFSSLR